VRIVLATALALVIAIPVDLAIEAFARQAFAVSPQFEPFQGTVAPYTAGGLILAGATFAVVRRFFRDATGVYVRLRSSRSCSRGCPMSRCSSSTSPARRCLP